MLFTIPAEAVTVAMPSSVALVSSVVAIPSLLVTTASLLNVPRVVVKFTVMSGIGLPTLSFKTAVIVVEEIPSASNDNDSENNSIYLG